LRIAVTLNVDELGIEKLFGALGREIVASSSVK
jgi:hypothetical protein